MFPSTSGIQCSDGHKMPLYCWAPIQPIPKAIVLIAHGMAEYALRYQPIAEALCNEGFIVCAYDQRGHGNAVNNTAALGITPPNWFNQQVNDIDVLVNHLRNTLPNTKIFLLGHSMGSFLSQRYFQLYGRHIDGLILSASNGKKDPLMGLGIMIAWLQKSIMGSSYKSRLINTLSFGQFNKQFKPNRTKADWLSRDEKEVDKYIADEQCGFVCSASFYYYFFKGISDGFKKENIANAVKDKPIYIFSGSCDPVGLNGKGVRQLMANWQQAGIQNIRFQLYPGGRHEMLNEINRSEVIENLVQFLHEHCS